MTYPVLGFTPHGVMFYSRYEHLLHETSKFYENLEIVDIKGACAVVRSVRITRKPVLAWLFGHEEAEIVETEKVAEYDVDDLRSGVLEWLSIYPDMYICSDTYDEVVKSVTEAKTIADLVMLFSDQ